MQESVKEIMRKLHESWDNKPCKIRKVYFDRQKNAWIYRRMQPKPKWLIDILAEGRFKKRKHRFLLKKFGKLFWMYKQDDKFCEWYKTKDCWCFWCLLTKLFVK